MKLRRLGATLMAAAALTAVAAPAASAAAGPPDVNEILAPYMEQVRCWAWLLAGGHC